MTPRPTLLVVFAAAFGLFACTPPAAPVKSAPAPAASPAGPSAVVVEQTPPPPEPGVAVPVTGEEPMLGDPLAPVTWVIFGDYTEPYSAKLFQRLEDYIAEVGLKRLRIVWRYRILPMHKEEANIFALAAETIFRMGGNKAFWAFSQRLFAYQGSVDARSMARWAVEVGVDPVQFAEAFAAETYGAKVKEGEALAKKLNLPGAPQSYINGIHVSGAQSHDRFMSVIEAQLGAADALAASGVARSGLYAAALEKNYKPLPAQSDYRQPADTITAWRVPLGKAPLRGKPAALVTIVMFGDFECRFCAQSRKTIEDLEKAYGDKLRFVFKHNPIPSLHPRAEAAAELALEARAEGGDSKFWEAFNLLFDHREQLTDQDLAGYAKTLGLKEKPAAEAVANHKYAEVIDADAIEGAELGVDGTPTFFLNGRRLLGAQSIEKFKAIIDEEVASAEKLVASGTPAQRVYETLQKDAQPPDPPLRVVVPAPKAGESPVKGPKGAKVVVQMFADFQCQYCKRVQSTLDDLMAAFPGKVEVVYRHLPLEMHKESEIAAEASVEAFKQKGDSGFWAFAKLLWEDQSAESLGKEGLVAKAKAAGLDADKMKAALDAGTHRAAVKADSDLAAKLKITATPSIAINDYFISGAQSLVFFKRLVKLALGPRAAPAPEQMLGAEPKKLAPPATAKPAPEGAQFGAKHIVVMYKGSTKAPEGLTRTRRQAMILAQSIRKRIKRGFKFEDLVKEYSDEPGAAARGGDLGTFPKGRMVPEFQAGLESTAVGEVSEVVETTFGFHVILRTK